MSDSKPEDLGSSPSRPAMSHLPEFWDEENWGSLQYQEYIKRRKGFWNWLMNWKDQQLHQLLGCFMTRGQWEEREAEQWPSKTGSYDPCEDHYNWLKGAGHKQEAKRLKKAALEIQPDLERFL